MKSEVKTIGSSGQISLGKQWAGRTVVVDELEPGVWSIKTAQVIPDNELVAHAGGHTRAGRSYRMVREESHSRV